VADVIAELFRGSLFIKIRGRKLYDRYFYFDPHSNHLTWFSKKTSSTRSGAHSTSPALLLLTPLPRPLHACPRGRHSQR
jgi:hypothetical protein